MKTNIEEKKLNEPLSQYISSAYNTLYSIVQGVALGALFYIVSSLMENKALSVMAWLKIITVASLISLLWHRYAVHNQFAAWRLEMRDTLIPIAFAISQFWFILMIREDLHLFFLAITIINIIGIFAYVNLFTRLKKEEAEQLFIEHFSKNKNFAKQLHNDINSFTKYSLIAMIIFTLINAYLTCLTYSLADKEGVTAITSIGITTALIFIAFRFDLRWYLNKRGSPEVRQVKW